LRWNWSLFAAFIAGYNIYKSITYKKTACVIAGYFAGSVAGWQWNFSAMA
jgi:hypothetical protein